MKFSKANAKIQALSKVEALKPYLQGKRKVYSFDLLSGFSCPFAEQCLSRAVADSSGKRKIKDGPKTEFRCFSASQEVQYNYLYDLRKGNFDALRAIKHDVSAMADGIAAALPKDAGIVRIHVGGDFFNENYMLAWFEVARRNPSVLFYAYTKSLPYVVNQLYSIPENFSITASRGGRFDHLIDQYKLREAVVVYSEQEAADLGLEIDHDDSHAAVKDGKNFALLIHGTQPKGSQAGAALQQLKVGKVRHSYSRKVVTA
jgi:hypothetical protein